MWLAMMLIILVATTTYAEDFSCTKPKIVVPGAIRDHYGYDNVRDGQIIEIYCSGNTNQLQIEGSFELQIQTVNETTIKAVIPANQTKSSFNYFNCKSNDCGAAELWLKFDYYPKITELSCYSKNIELLNCTITTQLNEGNYSLTRINGALAIPLCVNELRYLKQYPCVWDMSNLAHGRFLYLRNPHVLLHLEICSFLDCIHKEYDLDIMAITKLNAPKYLGVDISADLAVLELMPYHGPLVEVEVFYEVEYGLAGIPSSEIITNSSRVFRGGRLKLGLNLVCPGRQYTVRASCRPVNASSGYMSESAYITFESKPKAHSPDTDESNLDPICLIEPIDENPTVMIYKIKQLKKFIRQELKKFEKKKPALKKKIMSLKNEN